MTTNRSEVRERFDVPGFVSENRPEFENFRSVSGRSERPLFFARYRHDKPNLGLLEQTPLADQVIVSVELRPFRPINVFCDGHHKRKPASEPGALALYDMRRSWSADIRDPFDTLQVFLPINSFRDFATERRSTFLDFRYDIQAPRYDTVMLHLMQAMLPTLERPHEVSTLYLESMFLAARDHIAETYGGFTTRATSKRRWPHRSSTSSCSRIYRGEPKPGCQPSRCCGCVCYISEFPHPRLQDRAGYFDASLVAEPANCPRPTSDLRECYTAQ